MNKEDIVSNLEEKHTTLLNWLQNQEDDKWQKGPEGKWTSGQQALHLLQSIKPLNDALSMPKILLKFKFGKANRDLRDYDTIVNRYHERLKNVKGSTFKGSQNMKTPTLSEKEYILNRLQVENKKLQYKTLKRWNDKQLDSYILPHPLMGKMPVREIIMWTAYHIEHHTKILQEKY
ncbi:DinB family protein [Oceanihabitans sp. 2_MG-2023]|uniref:DinB family protein n=1 Tax=Oceanihabitans sp. 2_MG-2023 TaxID=3062661 RepID=UPI0026E11B5E|nr:DinB family protein [Oceanihabitans sp. 2_MG-2023]MDO6597500.1 DinB family protein [Oceanihabitans sp. 2_MG-2023]